MLNWRHERELFLTALAFLTRIPIPANTPYSPEHMNASARYFPIVGMIVGAFGALVYFLAGKIWPDTLAIALSMLATILLTGSFHEDGLADSCDAFGGGWRKEQILSIMKDSRIGTYAAVGLIAILGTKFLALSAAEQPAKIVAMLIVGHSWSRLLAISYLYDHDYVRFDDSSKIKPMATQLSRNNLLIAGLSAAPLVLLVPLSSTLLIVVTLLCWRWWFGRYIRRRIGGYTGDCLGCAQQVAEVIIYLMLCHHG
ncbi:MAG: adenosylcobinamide-GDP ribazoletransferase [Spongiibacteraceae bacterium]